MPISSAKSPETPEIQAMRGSKTFDFTRSRQQSNFLDCTRKGQALNIIQRNAKHIIPERYVKNKKEQDTF